MGMGTSEKNTGEYAGIRSINTILHRFVTNGAADA